MRGEGEVTVQVLNTNWTILSNQRAVRRGGSLEKMGLFPTWHLKGTAMRRKEKRWMAINRFIKEEGPVAVGKSGTDNTSVATNSGKVVG